MRISNLIFFCLLSACHIIAVGQEVNIFNLNIDNGLPDNHVYGLTTDKYGYLWMATEKGVVKYNGYECKVFNCSNGLPVEVTWQVYEDRKGRMWLGNLSNEMGYIYKDVYHKALLNSANRIIYPNFIQATDTGLIFLSARVTDNPYGAICVEMNDTIHCYPLPASMGDSTDTGRHISKYPRTASFFDKTGGMHAICGHKLYDIAIKNGVCSARFITISDLSTGDMLDKYAITYTADDYMCLKKINENENKFYVFNLQTGKSSELNIEPFCGKGEDVVFMYSKNSYQPNPYFYTVTTNYILKFKTEGIKLVEKTKLADLLVRPMDADKLNGYFVDEFWGAWLSIITSGMYIKYEAGKYQKAKNMSGLLDNYVFAGGRPDYITFWWQATTHTLAAVKNDNIIRRYKFGKKVSITRVFYYNNDSFFLNNASNYGNFWLDRKTEKLAHISNMTLKVSGICFVNNEQQFYVSVSGFYTKYRNDEPIKIDNDRYKDLQYDRLRKNYWVYNYHKILQYGSDEKVIIYNKDSLTRFGVNSVDKLLIDSSYGNVFLKGSNAVSLYDPGTNTYKHIFNDLYLNESDMFIYHDILIIIGKFGILFSKITGAGQIAEPVIYYNRKNIHYKRVYNVQISWNKILFGTDKGFYTMSIPGDSVLMNAPLNKERTKYKMFVYYKDDIVSQGFNDTVTIDQSNLQLRFDVINPYGNGKVKYLYKGAGNDTAWHELNSNEFAIPPSLAPGIYHHFSVMAHDDVWKGRKKDIYIYLEPNWWQKLYYNRFFFAGTIIFVLVLISIIVLITRKIVMKNNIEKNLKRELELKSIYSQINPHFIFNTLGTVMYFIKKQELGNAYEQVSRFSKLLRAYISSSRNTYITIAADVENLHNYIHLQQARFENKFDYQIIIDSKIDTITTKIPALLLQPIVENAIDHGLFHKEDKGCLKIEFRKTDLPFELCCIIDDDGIGRKAAKAFSEKSVVKKESYGEQLITDLVSIFNKYEQMRINIEYIDKVAPETGTTVRISIKYL